MADRSAEGDHGGDTGVQPLVTLSEAVHNANEAGVHHSISFSRGYPRNVCECVC